MGCCPVVPPPAADCLGHTEHRPRPCSERVSVGGRGWRRGAGAPGPIGPPSRPAGRGRASRAIWTGILTSVQQYWSSVTQDGNCRSSSVSYQDERWPVYLNHVVACLGPVAGAAGSPASPWLRRSPSPCATTPLSVRSASVRPDDLRDQPVVDVCLQAHRPGCPGHPAQTGVPIVSQQRGGDWRTPSPLQGSG